MGISMLQSKLDDSQLTDGILAANGVEHLANFSASGLGQGDKPFFLSVGYATAWVDAVGSVAGFASAPPCPPPPSPPGTNCLHPAPCTA